MKAKITDVGIPFNNQGAIGFKVGFECEGIHGAVFMIPGDDLKIAIGTAVEDEKNHLMRLQAATVLADNIRNRIGSEIDIG